MSVYNQWDWDISYPVINFLLNTGSFSSKEGIESRILQILDINKENLGVVCSQPRDIPHCFTELISTIYKKYQQKVVILIDKYDKPILDNIGNKEKALVAREVLKTDIEQL